jgi:hypothetical protein
MDLYKFYGIFLVLIPCIYLNCMESSHCLLKGFIDILWAGGVIVGVLGAGGGGWQGSGGGDNNGIKTNTYTSTALRILPATPHKTP